MIENLPLEDERSQFVWFATIRSHVIIFYILYYRHPTNYNNGRNLSTHVREQNGVALGPLRLFRNQGVWCRPGRN